MEWLQTIDTGLFRFINLSLSNPVLDKVMPFLSGNAFFVPAIVILTAFLIWKDRARGLFCVLSVLLIVALGDSLICNTIKHAVARPRPSITIADAHTLLGKGKTFSMPSSHAANWFAATMVAFVFYRRSLPFMLTGAVLVSFSRIYNGVHYPSDVLAGAVLGAGYAAGTIWSMDALWHWAGRKWFPVWWKATPSLFGVRQAPAESEPVPAPIDLHWVRLGYVWIAVLLLVRLAYIAGDTLQLTGDEAYQWLWSKHLALSYYSKPPMIAYTQFLGTSLWGDTAFGVRFFSPVIAAILSFMLLRFFAREINGRTGFALVLMITATPLMCAGAVLMTVDPLSVLFWTAAMVAGWRACQDNGTTRNWCWVGLWMGLGFLSKYTELLQWLCWAVFFALWPPARKHLRRPGPYVALGINLLLSIPVLIWNAQNNWVTISHVASNAGAGNAPKPFLSHIMDFVSFMGAELGLLNPVFFIGVIWASIVLWRRFPRNSLWIYFFSMGAPLFIVYMLFSFYSRVLPNWIAPSVLPLFCLLAAVWDARFRAGQRQARDWLVTGVALGLPLVVIAHNTELITKLTGYRLPVSSDPLHRAYGWSEVAEIAADARRELLKEGKPVFVIGGNYRLAGEITFYWPEPGASDHENPLIYCRTTTEPVNQFYFWPGYKSRKGQNAIFVRDLDRDHPKIGPVPEEIRNEFESVTDLGVREVMHRGRLLWPIQVFACRNLR